MVTSAHIKLWNFQSFNFFFKQKKKINIIVRTFRGLSHQSFIWGLVSTTSNLFLILFTISEFLYGAFSLCVSIYMSWSLAIILFEICWLQKNTLYWRNSVISLDQYKISYIFACVCVCVCVCVYRHTYIKYSEIKYFLYSLSANK